MERIYTLTRCYNGLKVNLEFFVRIDKREEPETILLFFSKHFNSRLPFCIIRFFFPCICPYEHRMLTWDNITQGKT